MSTLDYQEKRKLEKLLGMSSGYVLNYSDRTFGNLVGDLTGFDIHSEKYLSKGTSKANKFRTFWEVESDASVGQVLQQLILEVKESKNSQLFEDCQGIVNRLLAGGPHLAPLAEIAVRFDARHLKQEISRMTASVESDPDLAIGTAKELIETCCKTILQERGVSIAGNPEFSELTKATFSQLRLTRDDVSDATQGADSIRRVLSNLGSISNEVNRLRNLYGTGHGKEADASGLSARHAKLAVGAAATLVQFLFESHIEQMASRNH